MSLNIDGNIIFAYHLGGLSQNNKSIMQKTVEKTFEEYFGPKVITPVDELYAVCFLILMGTSF